MTKLLLPVPRRFRLWVARESKRIAWGVLFLVCLVICIDTLGFVEVYFERDFQTKFNYPLNVPNFPELVQSFGRGESVEYQPINENYSKINFHDEINSKCQEGERIGLLILVKSAPHYFEKRSVIRKTWGDSEYLQNISRSISSSLSPLLSCHPEKESPSFSIKLVFLLGQNDDKNFPKSSPSTTTTTTTTTTIANNYVGELDKKNKMMEKQSDYYNGKDKKIFKKPLLQKHSAHYNEAVGAGNGNFFADSFSEEFKQNSIQDEILKYNDIVVADFMDNYENNTYKTMIGIRYAMEKCSNFQFALLCDDDMHINLKNLIRFLESPREYPYVSTSSKNNVEVKVKKRVQREIIARAHCSNTLMMENSNLYAGKVLTTRPIRYKLGQVSKWYLSLQEYPFNYFPPYMPAAAVIMSKSVVQDFYWASFYTAHFRFDDVYLGLLAYKMNISPLNSNYFYVCHNTNGKCPEDATALGQDGLKNSPVDPLKHLIARHGLETPEELLSYWQDQKAEGNLDF